MKKQYLFLALFIIAALALLNFSKKSVDAPSALDNFAQCLAGRGFTMYGADWCPHCQNEKRAFGASFRFVTYVECPDNPKLCLEKGIEGYPTWILADGERLVGEQGIERLSQKSGCLLPQGNQ